jgi:Fur family ferric uptake transcriptional regulator
MNEPNTSPRRTRQRNAIVRALRDAAGPLTADEIHERAQGTVDQLGIATVYRTVKLLLESGEIQAVVLPDGRSRYEPSDRGHHHHFHCRHCEQVFDLSGCRVELPKNDVLPGGFRVEEHELTLTGLCPACRGAR